MRVDSVLMIAFGGPGRTEDVRPFLQLLLEGRPVPPARIEEVARHYEQIGGSPLSELTSRQARELEAELALGGTPLPVHVGMAHWHPFLVDTMRRMVESGEKRTVGVVLAPHRSEASWDKYLRAVAEARAALGNPPFEVVFHEPWHADPRFVEAVAEQVQESLAGLPARDRELTTVVFTAHSVPRPVSDRSGYAAQVTETARLAAARLGHDRWTVAWQSRSGRPEDPWLEPDVKDHLRDLHARGVRSVALMPVGFVCDHVEVLYDLDHEAAAAAKQIGLLFRRAKTVGVHPAFIRMLAGLVRKAI